jgi:hypothetical protein
MIFGTDTGNLHAVDSMIPSMSVAAANENGGLKVPMPDSFLDLWYQAAASPCGVCVFTTDRDALRQKLYASRAAAADPDLDKLSLVLSPTDETHVWIVKR